jgi:hypothetical protein
MRFGWPTDVNAAEANGDPPHHAWYRAKGVELDSKSDSISARHAEIADKTMVTPNLE